MNELLAMMRFAVAVGTSCYSIDQGILPAVRKANLKKLRIAVYRLGSPTADGHPRHPLYLPFATQLEEHVGRYLADRGLA